MGQVGVAADRAGGRAGRIQQDRIIRPTGVVQRVPDDAGGRQAGAPEVLPDPVHALPGVVQRGDLRPGGGQLQRFAAGRRTEVEDILARLRVKKSCGQGRGGVLYPPVAGVEPAQRRDLPRINEPNAARGQQRAAGGPGHGFGVVPGGQVQRRSSVVRGLHFSHVSSAIGFDQRAAQPTRQAWYAQVIPRSRRLDGELAQDGVDHALHVARAAVCPGHGHGLAHHPMRIAAMGQFGRGKAQDVADRQGWLFPDVARDQTVGAVDPAQGLGGQSLSPCAACRIEPVERAAGQQIGQEPPFDDHLVQKPERRAAGRRCGAGHGQSLKADRGGV